MDDVQLIRAEFDGHDFEGQAVRIVPEVDEPFVHLPRRRRDAEAETAMLDDVLTAPFSDSVLGRRPGPSQSHLRVSLASTILSDRTGVADHSEVEVRPDPEVLDGLPEELSIEGAPVEVLHQELQVPGHSQH